MYLEFLVFKKKVLSTIVNKSSSDHKPLSKIWLLSFFFSGNQAETYETKFNFEYIGFLDTEI